MTLTVLVYDTEASAPAQPLMSYPLGNNTIIGRTPGNHIVLPCAEHLVSRKHAVILHHEDRYFLHDCSTNGTFLNDNDTPIGREHMAEIRCGDHFHIGRYQLTIDASAAAQRIASSGLNSRASTDHATLSEQALESNEFSTRSDPGFASEEPKSKTMSFSESFDTLSPHQTLTDFLKTPPHSASRWTRTPVEADLHEAFTPPTYEIPANWLASTEHNPPPPPSSSVEKVFSSPERGDITATDSDQYAFEPAEPSAQQNEKPPIDPLLDPLQTPNPLTLQKENTKPESHREPEQNLAQDLKTDSACSPAQNYTNNTQDTWSEAFLTGLSVPPSLQTSLTVSPEILRRAGSVLRLLIDSQLQLRQAKLVWLNRLAPESIPMSQLLDADPLRDFSDATSAIQAMIDPSNPCHANLLRLFTAAQSEMIADLTLLFDTQENMTLTLQNTAIPEALEHAFQKQETEENVIRTATQRLLARRTRDQRRWQHFRNHWQAICRDVIRHIKSQFETNVLATLTIRLRQRKHGN